MKESIRKKIDKLDRKLFKYLDQRFTLVKPLGLLKKELKDPRREEEILKKTTCTKYHEEIQNIYKAIFSEAISVQKPKKAIIGKDISHSLSKVIYEDIFHFDNYEIINSENYKEDFFKYNYEFLNITSPYKKDAFKYATLVDDSSVITKSGNFYYQGVLYNTDFLGALELFKDYLDNENVVIFGKGAVSELLMMVFRNAKCFPSFINELKENDFSLIYEAEVVINASLYGNSFEEKFIVDLDKLVNLKVVIELNYKLYQTALVRYGHKHSLKVYDGLDFLLTQAFLNMKLVDEGLVNGLDFKKVKRYLLNKYLNIVIIGMPYAGKTELGKKISVFLDKYFIDTDELLVSEKKDINSLKLEDFRKEEKKVTGKLVSLRSHVFSLGGGSVLHGRELQSLSQTGIVLFLDTNIETIKKRNDGSRPLFKSPDSLESVYKERKELYLKYSDIIVKEDDTIEEVAKKIYEYFNC